MYVKDGATILADRFRVLEGILFRPVVLFAFRPLKVDATLSTGIGENLNSAHGNELILSLVIWVTLRNSSSLNCTTRGPVTN